MTTETESESTLEAQEALLYSARHGEINVVRDLIKAQKDGTITLDISCKGKSKSNFGWTPLHLSTYFGHPDVVEVLLMEGADIDAANDIGDTALHKASFIGHEELVVMLLKYGADITLMNGEGKLPRDMAKTLDIRKLLLATEHTEQREREKKLVSAAREGDLNTINKLLTSPQPPNINCVDSQGNTSLHCAAYRGHAQVAVILLQNGIDSSLRNCNGKLAVDLARDTQMRDVLSVRPVRQLQRNAVRFEGQLLRRSRFLGWRPCWAVLQRGVLWYYSNRAEATSASGSEAQRQSNNNPLGKVNVVRRREYKYLDGAKVTAPVTDKAVLIINFSDGDTHRLAIPPTSDSADALAARQAWITAYNEHIAYSSHYLWAGSYGIPPPKGREATEMADCTVADDDEDESKPLGSMRDALTSAANGLALMESQLNDCEVIVTALNKDIQMGSTLQQSAFMRFQHAANTGQKALGALKHCVALVTQTKDSAEAKLECEVERRRVLEEALAALAREHHDLERSYAEEVSGRKRTKKPKQDKRFGSDDEFYDTFDADSDSDTLVTAGLSSPLGALSPWEVTPQGSPNESPNKTPTNPASPNFVASNSDTFSPPLQSTDSMQSISVLSPASSCGTLISQGGNVYRDARDDSIRMLHTPRKSLPVQQFSRNDFSLWSVLKNCVGKELSKITMPVVFNEPLSFLQRMLEYLEYAHLLRLASEQEDPMARMEYVAGFAVSALASNWERLGKPFNPLLGETYELQRPEFRAVCEQVSHHPPVSAFHADSPHFVFHGSVHPKLKFWGKSVEIQPKGHVTVELPRWGEAYTWCNVNCCVHNVIVGRLWMEQHGGMEVVRHGGGAGAGLRAQLAFKPAGWAGRDLHKVEGFILNSSKKKVKHLYGKWTEFIKCCPMNAYEEYMRERKSNGDSESSGAGSSDGNNSSPAKTPRKVLAKLNSLKVGALRSMSMQETEEAPPELPDGEIPKSESTYSIDIPNSVTIWEAKARPPNSSDYYQFTEFAMSLNELESTHSLAGAAGGRAGLCPTDSRLRPDIRRLESGDIDGAALEKARLEEKQRVVRKRGRRPGAPPFAARWFSQGTNPYTRQEDWLYNGGYWDRNYQHLADIDIF